MMRARALAAVLCLLGNAAAPAAGDEPPRTARLDTEAFRNARGIAQDSRHHLWAMIAGKECTLHEWDGGKWIAHAWPREIRREHIPDAVAIDSRQRVWVTSENGDSTVGIYDPAQDAWQSFANDEQAYQAQLPDGVDFLPGPLRRKLPSFSDGRICFLDSRWLIHFFKGGQWRTWTREQITGEKTFPFDGPPFFSRRKNLAINIDRNTWEFTQQRAWHRAARARGMADFSDSAAQQGKPLALPSGWTGGHCDSAVADTDGAFWITAARQLYKACGSLCVPVTLPESFLAASDPWFLQSAFIDPSGNAVLVSKGSPMHPDIQPDPLLLLAGEPPRGTRATVERVDADAVTLRFSAESGNLVGYLWRLGDENWRTPPSAPVLRIPDLENGDYRITVAAVNEALQLDPSPFTLPFAINIDRKKQVTDLIRQLGDPDFTRRNAAVRALARQSAFALPALRAARETADADRQWWLDAAIQSIGRNEKHTPPAPR